MHLLALNSFLGPDTSWLLRTDILLGALTLICVAVVAAAVICGIAGCWREKKSDMIQGSRTTTLSKLGISVSDGGDQPDEKDLHPGQIPDKKTRKANQS